MDKEYITRLIYEYNPHLKGEGKKVPEFKRDLYFDVEKWLYKKQTIALVGLRRTGKTTIMEQLMKLVEKEASFFSFDEQETQNKDVLVFIIDFILNNLGSKYIFLDEIHFVEDWEGVLKRYYDQRDLKFIISGSESLELSKGKTSLGGRVVTFKLEPLSFSEYLHLCGRKFDIKKTSIENSKDIERIHLKLLTETEFYEKEFSEYLYKGAFPELINETDETVIRKYIHDLIVQKIIYRDIPAIFNIRRKELLLALFRYACENSANLFNIRSLCNTFDADFETVDNYLLYLQSAFLIKVAQVYSKSPAKRARRNKKMYICHPSIALGILGYHKNMLVDKNLGPYVESLFASKYFYRDKQKNEVDVIIEKDTLLPIEIKYQNQISNSELKSLLRFMEKYNIKRGIVITRKTMEIRKIGDRSISFVPAWLAALTN